MLTKEMFVHALQVLQEEDEKEHCLNEAMDAMSPDFAVGFYPLTTLQRLVIDLICASFDYDVKEDVEYFVYELDFGNRWHEGSITEPDGTPIDMSTAEKLYDYLVCKAGVR